MMVSFNIVLMLFQLPTYGKPTEDSHVLLDEETASDHTLKLNFIQTQPQAEQGQSQQLL